MDVIRSASRFFNNLIDVPSIDPDDSRRRKLLNIILMGMFLIAIITVILSVIAKVLQFAGAENISGILIASIAGVISCFLVYLINRFWSGTIASVIFLLIFVFIITLADTPHELTNGRSIYLLSIPIIIAGVLLGSKASLAFWGVATLEFIILGYNEINLPAIMSFLWLATIAWLSARSLEHALKDLRNINAELDRRVIQRTHELTESLSRERIETGRRDAILNGIADGVVVFDQSGLAILANPSISNMIDMPLEKIIGSTINELLSSGLKAGGRETLEAQLERSSSSFSNLRIEWEKKTLLINASEVRDDRNQPTGIVAVLRDFTREAELEKMKDSFIAIVSHELRTPLNAILGYAEMFKEGVYGPMNEKQLSVTQRIMMNTQRLLSIVSDLLDQAQIQAGKLKTRMVSCVPAELLENFRGVMEKIVTDKGLPLFTELDPALPLKILGDPQRLHQIMVNLANNAVKFTDKGGITVSLLLVDKSQWCIKVSDTGRGIPSEAQKYIFESFRQVDAASTRQHGGVGLGLSIVKQLVEIMHGRIEVESKYGSGSVFTVTLPLIVNAEAQTQPIPLIEE